MDFLADPLARAQAFVSMHATDVLLGALVLSILALLLALWSLLRRRGVRRLRRQVIHLEQRVRRLELSGERQQTVAAIHSQAVGREQV